MFSAAAGNNTTFNGTATTIAGGPRPVVAENRVSKRLF
jgi:hypothetical protein